jgi:general secretion pathway protein M
VSTDDRPDESPDGQTARIAALEPLRLRWAALSPPDRGALQLAAAVLTLFLVWVLAVQPAWRTLARAPAELDALDLQWQGMQALATESAALRATPPVSLAQATEALQAATAKLGDHGRLTLQGDRAVLNLNGIGTAALANWLAEARAGARVRPIEATLNRGPQGYSGSLVVGLAGGA